jgi:hypothetical protein
MLDGDRLDLGGSADLPRHLSDTPQGFPSGGSIDFDPPRLSNNPNLPFLRSALVHIGEELDRENSSHDPDSFSPFAAMEGFALRDRRAEMTSSLRVAPNNAGLLRFGQDRAPRLSDLPKLTVSAARTGSRPTKAEPVSFEVTASKTKITGMLGGAESAVAFDELQNVRVDNTGRFFFMVAGDTGEPLCLKMTPWIVPALALLMAGAARKDVLKELEAEMERKVRAL